MFCFPLRGTGRPKENMTAPEGEVGVWRGRSSAAADSRGSPVTWAIRASSAGILKHICPQPLPLKGKEAHLGSELLCMH